MEELVRHIGTLISGGLIASPNLGVLEDRFRGTNSRARRRSFERARERNLGVLVLN